MGKPVASKSKHTLNMPEEPGKSRERQMADVLVSSSFQSAATIQKYGENVLSDVELMALHDSLKQKNEAIAKSDLNVVEAMLFNQAQSLQTIFTSMARRAAMNAGEYVNAADTYLRLALKAQAQCRATLETLAEIKNPQPTAFIRQQNIAANQQVNNGTSPSVGTYESANPARTGNSGNQSIEQSAVTYEKGQRLDLGASTAAGKSNPAMATLDSFYRT